MTKQKMINVTHRWTLDDLTDDLPQRLRDSKQDTGLAQIYLADGDVIMPTRMAIIHMISWRPMLHCQVAPSTNEVFEIKNITSGTFPAIRSKLYDTILSKRPDLDYLFVLEEVWKAIDDMAIWIEDNVGEYQCSMSALSLCRLMDQPEIKPLVDLQLDQTVGTDIIEKTIKQVTKELSVLIGTRDAIKQNVLLPFMETGSLKERQIPQMMISYGPRSDINDVMFKFSIPSSAMSGLQNAQEYAIESQSAKKASYFNKVVICDSQYFNRRLRLTCGNLPHIYPGDCGSTVTMPYRIPAIHATNFIDKVVVEDGKEIRLTKKNILDYVDRVVQLVSPLGCRYTDGICERCAGRGNRNLIKYMPPGIHIGLLSASKVGSVVSQMVLSAKHLINTITKIYNLPTQAAKYFIRVGDKIYWKKQAAENLINVKMRIPFDALGPITDLSYPDVLPDAESYSKVAWFELYKGDQLVDQVEMEYDCFIPYLSKDTLTYIRTHFKDILVDTVGNSFVIGLSNFDPEQPFFKFTIVNDDMIKFTESIDQFLNKQIGDYTSGSLVLQDFTTLLYSKTKINFFWVENIIKAFAISSRNNYAPPVVSDITKMCFGNMKDVISEGSLSMKLAYERLNEYFNQPVTSLRPRQLGLFSPFFGL